MQEERRGWIFVFCVDWEVLISLKCGLCFCHLNGTPFLLPLIEIVQEERRQRNGENNNEWSWAKEDRKVSEGRSHGKF